MTEFEIRVVLADPEFAKLVKRWAAISMEAKTYPALEEEVVRRIGDREYLRPLLVFIDEKNRLEIGRLAMTEFECQVFYAANKERVDALYTVFRNWSFYVSNLGIKDVGGYRQHHWKKYETASESFVKDFPGINVIEMLNWRLLRDGN